jgi:hypothetical protein
VVRTTPDVARRRPHVPPPCPTPPRPETPPAPASPAPFTPAVMAVHGGKREASVPAHQPSATSCLARETARPEGGDSRPIGRQHRRLHLDGPAPAQRQGVRAALRAAHRANQADTEDKKGLGGWRRRAPVGRHAQGEGRAVPRPHYLTCHHMRGQNCRPERLWTAPPRRVRNLGLVCHTSANCLSALEAVMHAGVSYLRAMRRVSPRLCDIPAHQTQTLQVGDGRQRHQGTHQGKTSPHTAERPPWGTAIGRGHAHAAPEASPRAV